mmetsp:Transcript_33333/g.62158  ORF Transcript_33333/g.62158 Transcript_33333/m.62158 type:complete len:224 (+) Transcript_33333:1611-2282(+)
MQHCLGCIRDVPRRHHVVRCTLRTVAPNARVAHLMHHIVQELRVRKCSALVRRICALVAELRKHPQVAPARQRVRLRQPVVGKRKAAVVPAVVLLLSHAALHHLHRPLHLPRVLGDIHHALRVRRHHSHVEALVGIQLGRVDVARHHRTLAVHASDTTFGPGSPSSSRTCCRSATRLRSCPIASRTDTSYCHSSHARPHTPTHTPARVLPQTFPTPWGQMMVQ